jgi:hypothetical protein
MQLCQPTCLPESPREPPPPAEAVLLAGRHKILRMVIASGTWSASFVAISERGLIFIH